MPGFHLSRPAVAAFSGNVIEGGWLLAVLVLPSFFNIYSSRIFEPDKAALLRSFAVVVAVAWLVHAYAGRHDGRLTWSSLARSARRHPLAAPVLVVVMAYALATMFSVLPRASVFGSYFRLQGTVTTLAYLTLFAAAVVHLRRDDQMTRLLASVALSSLPVALYTLVQYQGWDPLAPWDTDVRVRPPANFGNPIFVGGYLVMTTLVVLGLTTDRLRRLCAGTAVRPLDVAVTAAYAAILVLGVVAIVLTESRGPLLALYVGLLSYACLAAAVQPLRRVAVAAVLALLLLPAGLVVIAAASDTGIRSRRSLADRWTAVLDTRDGSVGVRMTIWQGVINRMISPDPLPLPDGGVDAWHRLRPLVGYGPESLAATFHPTEYPDLARTAGRLLLVDRAHSDMLDTVATTGFIGLVGALWLFLAVVQQGLRYLGMLSGGDALARFRGRVLGGAVLVSVVAVAWKGPALAALGVPLGIAAGILLHIARSVGPGRSDGSAPPAVAPGHAFMAIGLLASILAHFVEISVGIATVATRTYFWLFAAALVVIGARRLDLRGAGPAPAAVPREGVWTGATAGAALVAVVLLTLGHDYLVFDMRLASWGRLFDERVADAPPGIPSWTAVGLFGATWVIGSLVLLGTATDRRATRRRFWQLLWQSFAIGSSFWLIRSWELRDIAEVGSLDASSIVALGDKITGLATTYLVGLLALLVLLALSLSDRRDGSADAGDWRDRAAWEPWSAWELAGYPLAVLGALWLAYGVGVRPIQADTLYNIGRQITPQRPELAGRLYERAADRALFEEYYSFELQRLREP